MKLTVAAAAALLALPLRAQDTSIQLAPLVPAPKEAAKETAKPTAPKKKKPASGTDRKKAPAKAAPPAPQLQAAQPALAAPPLVKLSNVVGVVAPDALAEALRAVAQAAPQTQAASLIAQLPAGCDDAACVAADGSARKLDQVLVASSGAGAVRVRLFDVLAKQQIGAAEAAATGAQESAAIAQALACKVLAVVPCTGTLEIAHDAAVRVTVDGAPPQESLPAGVHVIEASAGAASSRRTIALLRGETAQLSVDRDLHILAAGESVPAVTPLPGAALAAIPAAPARSPWIHRGGYAALAAGAAVGIAGVIVGAKSRSDLNGAESAYRSTGAYRSSDLGALQSGNSAAKTANVLFAASAACLATGALLTFAF
jgi:hypothetical protein